MQYHTIADKRSLEDIVIYLQQTHLSLDSSELTGPSKNPHVLKNRLCCDSPINVNHCFFHTQLKSFNQCLSDLAFDSFN